MLRDRLSPDVNLSLLPRDEWDLSYARRKTAPEPLHGQQHTPAALPSATATNTPLAPSSPPRGVQRLHCTPQTYKGMRKLTQAVNWGRWRLMGGHGSPSSARGDPNWSSCASTALTVPCPIPGRTPAQGHLSQSAWTKVWGSQACPPSLCQDCWARLALFLLHDQSGSSSSHSCAC